MTVAILDADRLVGDTATGASGTVPALPDCRGATIIKAATVSAVAGGTISSLTGSDRLLIAPPKSVSDLVSAASNVSAIPILAWILARAWYWQRIQDSGTLITRRVRSRDGKLIYSYTVELQADEDDVFGEFIVGLDNNYDTIA